jgi:hypothetical protein
LTATTPVLSPRVIRTLAASPKFSAVPGGVTCTVAVGVGVVVGDVGGLAADGPPPPPTLHPLPARSNAPAAARTDALRNIVVIEWCPLKQPQAPRTSKGIVTRPRPLV